MKDLIIVGTGGLGREVKWLIEECNKVENRWNILGWMSLEEPGTIVDNLPVLGGNEWLLMYDKPADVAIALGEGKLWKKVVEIIGVNKNLSFPVIISPTAEISETVKLGKGSIITAKNILTVNINIGEFFYCNLACTVGHDCIFGNYVTLNPGANVSGNVKLGECVNVGTGASIKQGIRIADGAIIGASAAVVKNVDFDCTVVGVPARAQ